MTPGTTVCVDGSPQAYRLMAVEDVYDSSRKGLLTPTAFLRPVAGGIEVGVPLERVRPVCEHKRITRRSDGAYCTSCKALIYPGGSTA